MTDEKPKYGKIKDRWVLDEHGSTLTESTNYRDSTENYPKRRDYEYRHPCDRTDIQKMGEIVKALFSDESKIDPNVRLESRVSNGKRRYYVVECYAKLVY